ncbi:MAG: cytidylate kinase-like family protein [Treponema sp.]|nr:cytidylate kinase-like family protein [Treponema sp.]
MAIITISRELAALGDETANELAKTLGCRLVDKNSLENLMQSYGETDHRNIKYDEKKPSFLASLTRNRDDYLHYLKTAIFSEAGKSSCIIIGRGASVILKKVPGVFSVFLTAPMDIRIERVKNYFHCDERRARQIIEQSDKDREAFHRYYFDSQWKDTSNYHLALNTGHLHPEVCAEIVKYLEDRIINRDAEEQNIIRIRELSLEQTIKHCILYEKEIPIHFLEINVSKDQIILYGVTSAPALTEAALASARDSAGAGFNVVSEIQVVHDYSMVP